MVCVLTPYQDVLVSSALRDIKWLDNFSGKFWLSAELLSMVGLLLKSHYSLIHRLFSLLSNSFLIHNKKMANFALALSITLLLE